jgi:hypothetical protein
VSPVKYEQGFYIPEADILHSHCRENLKSYNRIDDSFPHLRKEKGPVSEMYFSVFRIPEEDHISETQ